MQRLLVLSSTVRPRYFCRSLAIIIVALWLCALQDIRFAVFHQPFSTTATSKLISPERVNASRRYIRSVNTFQRNLQFLHIPKTAGSTIEGIIAPRQANLSWGMCRFPNRAEYHCGTLAPDWFLAPNTTHNNDTSAIPWRGQPSFWHTVPHLFRPNDNPYENFDVFTVIRDPVDRAVSEYYYHCFAFRKGNACKMNITSFFDYKLRQLNSRAMIKYWIDDSHLVPQYEYVFRPLQVRQVDFVLTLNVTSIGHDFDSTVQSFGLPMHWPGTETRASNALSRAKREQDTLADYMIERIKGYYEADYQCFSF